MQGEIAFTKYPKLLALEERHGVAIGTAYRSDREGAIFADLIALSIAAALKCKINSVNLTSVLPDDSTDAAIIDQEAFLRDT